MQTQINCPKNVFVNQNFKPKIGIVSGIGPLAGSDVLAKVFKCAALSYGAVEDSDYPDVVLINHGIAGVDNTGLLNDSFKSEIISMVHQLESNNANIIGIACNTAHLYLKDIDTNQSTTLINLIESTAITAAQSKHKYLLLTSTTSKQQKLYQGYLDKYKVSYKKTNDKQQKKLDDAIGLVMAYKLKSAGKLLESVIISAKKSGFDAIIAGCTELPIAIANCKNTYGLIIIDSNEILAKTLVKEYYHKTV